MAANALSTAAKQSRPEAGCSGGRELDRDLVVAARERRRQDPRLGTGCEAPVGDAAQQLLEHDADLEARERRAETEVRFEPERDVVVVLAQNVEPAGAREP